ncbi:hypothetical protein JX265_010371 [Neoarthrinium moseri]|uniref:Uncharacterized protein n=1 Tax=Neoarthrinium moseri TaxID=1658444 RepID=A0A9Q0ALM1_9PEZI|nr:hypothetical protein JX266_009507 [Neoarthrinium moseri]KAI1859368.1 hypothetical protein JX265_010371 [Neoarthrinium moseri]
MKYYDEFEIEWQDVETQLRKWGNLLRLGKRLVVKVSFKLVNTSSSAAKSETRTSVGNNSDARRECSPA